MLNLYEKFVKYFWMLKYYINNVINIRIKSNIFKYNESKSYWDSIKKTLQKGSDEFVVVGNGPSLDIYDLQFLDNGKRSFIASNKIYLMFEYSKWRPDFITISDPLVAYKHRNFDVMRNLGSIPLWVPEQHYYMYSKKVRKYIHTWKHVDVFSKKINCDFLPNPENSLFDSGTVSIQNIQLAIWLGAKKIYLIGFDHFYSENKGELTKSKTTSTSVNHFHPEYRKKNEVVNSANTELMEYGYNLIEQIAQKNDVEIVNISRKTALNTFKKHNYFKGN